MNAWDMTIYAAEQLIGYGPGPLGELLHPDLGSALPANEDHLVSRSDPRDATHIGQELIHHDLTDHGRGPAALACSASNSS